MQVQIYQTQGNAALKADGIVYGLVMEIAFILFMVPFTGFCAGLFFSFSKRVEYSLIGISFLLFVLIWYWFKSRKKEVTMEYLTRIMIYGSSVKYIIAESHTLIITNEDVE